MLEILMGPNIKILMGQSFGTITQGPGPRPMQVPERVSWTRPNGEAPERDPGPEPRPGVAAKEQKHTSTEKAWLH